MANKRKRRKRNAGSSSSNSDGKVWPNQIVDELLSYLDSEVAFLDPVTETKRKRDLQDVDQELALHLNCMRDGGEDSLEQVRNYTAKQIRAKLTRVYATCKRTENTEDDWTVIYTRGSACIDWTDDSERQERIVRRSKEIKHNWHIDFLHSPRKTRASSQVNGSPRNPAPRSIRGKTGTSNLRKRMEESRVAGSHPLRQKRVIDEVQHVRALSVHGTKLNSQVSDTESFATEDDDDPCIKVENIAQTPSFLLPPEADKIERDESSPRDSPKRSESEPEAFGTRLGDLSPASGGNAESNTNLEELPSSPTLEQRLQVVEEELQKVRRDAALEIDFWKAKYSTANHDRSKLKQAKSAIGVKLGALLEGGSKLSIDDLVKSQAVIDHLLDERDSRERVQNFQSNVDLQPDDETITKVSKLMQDIGVRLEATLKDAKFTSGAELRTLPQDHLLRSLVEQTFGIEWDSPDALRLLERWHERPELRQYGLLALCGAALAHWVFQQTQADVVFDRYESIVTRSSTNRYRDAIRLVGQSDPALARAVDLVVHKNLAKEDCFEHFQRAKSKDLARRLQEALAPLYQLDPDNGESDADSEVDGYAIGQLSEVFFHAMEVHCRLVLTGRRYECAWHEPGTPFDRASMDPYEAQEVMTPDTSTVRLTLLPGINQVTDSRINVDFGGFDEQCCRGHERAVCLVRAVVLRGSADVQ